MSTYKESAMGRWVVRSWSDLACLDWLTNLLATRWSLLAKTRGGEGGGCVSCTSERERCQRRRLPLGGHCLLTLCTALRGQLRAAKKLESETSGSWVVNRLECEHSLYVGVSARDCEYTHSTARQWSDLGNSQSTLAKLKKKLSWVDHVNQRFNASTHFMELSCQCTTSLFSHSKAMVCSFFLALHKHNFDKTEK